MLHALIVSTLFLAQSAAAVPAVDQTKLLACDFAAGQFWARESMVYRAYINPSEAKPDLSPTVRFVEDKIPSLAYSAQVWGFVALDGSVGLIMEIFAPGQDEAVDTKIVYDLSAPDAEPDLFYTTPISSGRAYYRLSCVRADLAQSY